MAAPTDSAEGGSDYYDSGDEHGNDLGDVMKENRSDKCLNRSRFYRGGLCMKGHNPISRVIMILSLAWLCERKLRDPCGITRVMTADDPLGIAGNEPSVGAQGIAGIELYEQGTYDQEFAQAVISVAAIMEEGVFCEITLYL
ncbi:unnamed protein product [Ectocarpus sp. CCAP 1310/34]|nr:unnamed protein product [Ectocarpus sp. CCAP 1310/34]